MNRLLRLLTRLKVKYASLRSGLPTKFEVWLPDVSAYTSVLVARPIWYSGNKMRVNLTGFDANAIWVRTLVRRHDIWYWENGDEVFITTRLPADLEEVRRAVVTYDQKREYPRKTYSRG